MIGIGIDNGVCDIGVLFSLGFLALIYYEIGIGIDNGIRGLA